MQIKPTSSKKEIIVEFNIPVTAPIGEYDFDVSVSEKGT